MAHHALGPGEQANHPITVHMANGKDRTSFGFSGMRTLPDKRVRALFDKSRRGTHDWVHVEQIQPYEWREVADL